MKVALTLLSLLVLILGLSLLSKTSHSEWTGVDETVIGKFAHEAKRQASAPLIDIEKGDLALFAFLVAGVAGGFLGGYYFRELFPPEPARMRERRDA